MGNETIDTSVIIVVNDIIKYSLNNAYTFHYRKKMEAKSKLREAISKVVSNDVKQARCNLRFDFLWAGRKLDTDNCVSCVKVFQDFLFKQDNIVQELTLTSNKGQEKVNSVKITITYI